MKKYGGEIHLLEKELLVLAIFFELEKIKTFFSYCKKFQEIGDKLYTSEKDFL